MSIDRRITNGLAWAGVLLVVGVPTADLLSAQFSGNSGTPVRAQSAVVEPAQVAAVEPVAPMPAPLSQRPAAPVAEVAAVAPANPVTAATKPVATPVAQTAAVVPAKPAAPVAKPAATPAAQTADAVDAYLQSGRPLPSYISGAEAPAAPTQVAATPPARTPIITTPAQAEVDPIEVAAIPPQKTAPVPMPLSMRPAPVEVALVRDPVLVIPSGLTPATPEVVVRPPAEVTAADLEDWESGPLSEFLARRGQQAGNSYVEPNGFFLEEEPKRSRARVIGREVAPFFLFAD